MNECNNFLSNLKLDVLRSCNAEEYEEVIESSLRDRIFDSTSSISSIDDIIEKLGRKWRENLEDIRFIAQKYKNYTILNPVQIPTTFPDLVNHFGSHQNVSNVLKKCQDVGLLVCKKSFFSIENEEGKAYYINQDIRDIILSYYSEKEIFNSAEEFIKVEPDVSIVPEDIKDSITISPRLNINYYPEEVIQRVVIDKYPIIKELLGICEEVNDKYLNKYPELIRKAYPGVVAKSRGKGKIKKIVKIGVRDSSIASSLPSHFSCWDEEDIYNKYIGTSRNKYLYDHFCSSWFEFDVKSSIWRITKWVNTGIWESRNVDMYELIYGKKFNCPEEREVFKKLSMPLYFDSYNLNIMYAHHCQHQFKHCLPPICKCDEFINTFTPIKKNIENNIGPTYDSKIFVIESYIYAILSKTLLDEGFELVQIYDGFYVKKREDWTQESFVIHCEELLRKITDDIKFNRPKLVIDLLND